MKVVIVVLVVAAVVIGLVLFFSGQARPPEVETMQAGSQKPETGEPQAGFEEVPKVDVLFADEIVPGLWLGGADAANNLDDPYNTVPILRVLDMTLPEEAAVRIDVAKDRKLGRKRAHLPIDDHPSVDISGVLPKAVDFIAQALQYEEVPILVHCRMGVSRSVAMVIAYLVEWGGMEVNEALAHVRSKRKVAGPNPGFMKQLEGRYAKMRMLLRTTGKEGFDWATPPQVYGGRERDPLRGE